MRNSNSPSQKKKQQLRFRYHRLHARIESCNGRCSELFHDTTGVHQTLYSIGYQQLGHACFIKGKQTFTASVPSSYVQLEAAVQGESTERALQHVMGDWEEQQQQPDLMDPMVSSNPDE
jgi:hypothetical protein